MRHDRPVRQNGMDESPGGRRLPAVASSREERRTSFGPWEGALREGRLVLLLLALLSVACRRDDDRAPPPSPNAPVPLAAIVSAPYRLYAIILNPGTHGFNIGLDSAFLSVEEAVADPATGLLGDLTPAAVAEAPTTGLRFNRSAGTFRSRLEFLPDGTARISEGLSAAGLFESFASAPDDRLGVHFVDLDDRTLSFETEIEFVTRSTLRGRATLDADRASVLEATAETVAMPLRLRSVALTSPARPPGEVLVRAEAAASTGSVSFAPLSLHGFGIALKESPGGRVFDGGSFAGPGGEPRRFTALLFEVGRSDVTDVRTEPGPAPATRTATTVRRPLQTLAVGELAIGGAGDVVFGSFAPGLGSEFGLGVDRVVLAVEGRFFPLEGLAESPRGANTTGLFGAEIETTDGGPVGATIRIVEMKLAESGSVAVGIGTASLETRIVVSEDDGSTLERTSIAEVVLLAVLVANDGAAPPATVEQGNEYHYLAMQPFDPAPSATMAFPQQSTAPNETRTIEIQNGGPAPRGGAIGATGGGVTLGLAQFLVGVAGIGEDFANRYRWTGRIDGRGAAQVGAWESPGRGDLLIGQSFQFGSFETPQGAEVLPGRLGDFAVITSAGAFGVGLSEFDNPNGARLFVLSRRRAIDQPTVQILLDLFR